MAEMLIEAERIVPGDLTTIAPGHILIRDGVVAAVGEGPLPRRPDVRLDSGVLVPGFVDLQVNGYFGAELEALRPDEWRMIAARLPQTGTTAFMPTFITAPVAQLTGALHCAASLARKQDQRAEQAEKSRQAGYAGHAGHAGYPGRVPGARVLGVHLEGPFISPLRAGAHNKDWMTDPAPGAISELLDAGRGVLKIVTLAPELPGALDAITRLAEAGVLVSVGHTDALASQVAAAAAAGARMVTHLFNAQRPLHHREPGVPGQALTDPRLTSGLIADFHHVAPEVCALAFAAAPGRIHLVTDAAACAGMPPGTYLLGGEPIELPAGDGMPPIRASGALAGSALRMDVAVANMVRAGAGLPATVAAATRIPADLIGRPELGRIAPGALADLAWLGEDLRARATWVAGDLVYSQ